MVPTSSLVQQFEIIERISPDFFEQGLDISPLDAQPFRFTDWKTMQPRQKPTHCRRPHLDWHRSRVDLNCRDPGNFLIADEMKGKVLTGLAVKTKHRQRERRLRLQNRHDARFNRQLLLDVRALRKPEDPLSVDLEGHAVTTLAEVCDGRW
jgi:hypothetical protein